MRKAIKKAALILAFLFLLSGCGSNTVPENDGNDINEPEQTVSDTETEYSETTEPPPQTEVSKKEDLLLSDISLSELSKTRLEFSDKYLEEYWDRKDHDLGSLYISYRDEHEIYLKDTLCVRDSTKKLAVSDNEKQDFISAVSGKSYTWPHNAEKAYSLTERENICLWVESVKKNGSELAVNVKGANCGYSIEDEFTVNAFVSRDDNGNIQFIIDPAYMIGIPLIGKNPEHYTFDINGKEVMMDSFICVGGMAQEKLTQEFKDVFEELGNEFFYVKIGLDYMSVEYDFESGYDCYAMLNRIEVITDDVDSVLNAPIKDMFTDSDEKPTEMTEAYNAIMDNYDTICKDSTRGIVLLDLDFDGKAELLVSDVEVLNNESIWSTDMNVDVSIYRIENNGLKYIDTFPCDYMVVYDVQMSLGLKELPDGTKGWFTTDNKGDGFVYKLIGDQWIPTEIFRQKTVEGSDETEYFFMGEKIIPNVIHEEESNSDEMQLSDIHYEWNGSYSYWGEMWELYGKIREDYCADIEETYILYSDWLTENIAERIAVTPREASYNIAYLVDSFYLGDYNPASHTYNYRFLGDYAKPVIYLYPTEETDVSVKVSFAEEGELTCTYPDYNGGWNVTALPDGTLYDMDGNEYYCLYWEGKGSSVLDGGEGWCVKGEDTAAFLREKLLEIGLTAREANEFIIYWLPEMQDNAYNIITFHTEDYALSVPLEVSPAPDTLIRVFMTFEASEEEVEITPQKLPHYERNGFTLVEWGGSEVK